MRNIKEVKQQTTEVNVSEVDSVTMGSDDNDQTHSGVSRRIIVPDLYELIRRLEGGERHSGKPSSAPSTAWSYTVPVLIFLMLLVGSIRYFGHRVDSVEKLQREETLAQRSELESKQHVIDQLQQTIRQQARSQRAIPEAAALAIKKSATVAVGEADAVPKSAPALQRPARAPLPASLEPGQVLLIVASTRSKEEALDLALTFELDGHVSEVVRGLTGYYGVALGRFEFEQAESMKTSMVESGVAKSTPYLMPDALVDSYVYP